MTFFVSLSDAKNAVRNLSVAQIHTTGTADL